MADYVAAVGLLLSIYSLNEQDRARKHAERASHLNAQFKLEETAEQVRRAKEEAKRKEAYARAAAAATGFFGESFDLYIQDLVKADDDQIKWMQKAGESQARILAAGGQVQSDTMMANEYSTFGQGLLSSYQIYASGKTK